MGEVPAYVRQAAGSGGQTIILFVLAMSIVFVIGVLVVDFGLWLSERRGAQKDADAAVLAGAQALLKDMNDTNGAFQDAVKWAGYNGVDASTIDGSPTTNCSPGNSCIAAGTSNCREDASAPDSMPWVEARIRHPGANLFSSIFTLGEPDIGAIARACIGSPSSQSQLSPFGVQTNFVPAVGPPEAGNECLNEDDDDGDGTVNDGCPLSDCLEPNPADPSRTRPIYGAVCILKTGAQGSVAGQRGQLTIGETDCSQTSTSTLKHDFHYGANAFCQLDQEVTTGTGNIIGLLQGLNERLLEEGRCDQYFYTGNAGYDDFNEVLSLPGAEPGDVIAPSPDHVFSLNDCWITSGQDGVAPDPEGHVHTYIPRAIDLVLIDELEQGDQTATITGFAGFYVIGCYDDSIAVQTKGLIEQNLNDVGSYLNRCDHPKGQDDILGIFVKKLAPPEAVTNPDPNLPLTIVLVK
jgi:hypothetical protein